VTHPALGVPVSVATADLTLEGRTARIPGMELRLGQDRLTVDGVLSGLLAAMGDGVPDFRGTVRGPRLSLADLNASPPPDSAVTYGRLAFARVGDRRVRGLSADAAARDRGFSRPTSLPVAGEVQASIDTVLDRKGRMEEVRATVRFGPDFVQVTDADFRRYGGRIRTSANLEFGDDATEPFSFDLAVEGVEAGDFLGETTPLGQAITGTLDMRVAFTGALNRLLLPTRESLQGRGSFALTGGGVDSRVTERLATFLGVDGLRQLRLQDWSSGFTLRDGQVVLEESILRGAPGSPQVGGGIALNGELDLVAAFDLPRQEVAASALERLGFADAGRQVRAVVRVRGTVDDPRIEADPEASVAEWTEGLEEEAQEEIDQVLREQQEALEERATSFLRGLLGGSRGAAGDTLPPDTLAPDTLRPDTFPRTPLPGG
ncbi:MAG: AsmA-like C-terminal region-containing protein, partial [Gemmatimonadota bacterium]